MTSVPIEATTCPSCGELIDMTTHVPIPGDLHDRDGGDGPVRPRDGDFVICVRCESIGRIVIDAFGTRVRAATREEEAEFVRQTGYVVSALREVKNRDRRRSN